MLDGPDYVGCLRDTLNTLEHITLTNVKARHIHALITESTERRRRILIIAWQVFQAQQPCNRAPTLRPRARVDLHLPSIIQRHLPLLEVKAIPKRATAETKLVP